MTPDQWHAADMTLWQGRSDAAEQGDTRRLFNIVRSLPPQATKDKGPGGKVLVGFACDAGVQRNQGRPGAAQGPMAIRRALAGLPAHAIGQVYDAGDVVCVEDQLEVAQDALAYAVSHVLSHQGLPIVLGGGHEIAWGTWQGLQAHLDAVHDTGRVLILNLDAHFDLRTSRPGSSGTPFDQIAAATRAAGGVFQYACLGISRLGNTASLFEHAEALGVQYLEDTAMQERHLDQVSDRVRRLMADADHVYLTVDLDVLPAAVMPAVSAPAAYGVPMSVIETIIQQVRDSGKLRVADFAEFNPRFDQDGRGARVAARLAYRLLETPGT